MPPEVEWLANLCNKNTKRAYQADVRDFTGFVGIGRPEEFRIVTRAHVIAWRDVLLARETVKSLETGVEDAERLAAATVRRKLSALSSLFEYLCEQNAVPYNPVKGPHAPPQASALGFRRRRAAASHLDAALK